MFRIPCTLYRGGTSKGPFFLKSDLPSAPNERDELLLALMGSPHARQIDGIGGGDSLSSKVAIVGPSDREDADIDYLLCHVHVTKSIVETTLNCGNILSAVAPFAIEKGLVSTSTPETEVRIYNENTGVVIVATVQTSEGFTVYEGNTAIDGVPGTAAPIKLSFINAVGAKTGKLLPTGNVIDDIDGIPVSCVDVAVPMVIIKAASMGKTGYETKNELDEDPEFLGKLEYLRCTAATKMGLGDVSQSISPKICLVSEPRYGGAITSRYFTPFDCHAAHAVSGGLCLAAAALISGTIANEVSYNLNKSPSLDEREIVIEHSSGKMGVSVIMDVNGESINFPHAAFIRTARPLFDGWVLAPNRKPIATTQNLSDAEEGSQADKDDGNTGAASDSKE